MSSSLYRIQDLVKRYGRRTVLEVGLLSVEKGKIYALLGPNGAGKTTLLEILSFLLPPTSGTIWFEERPVDFSSGLTALRRRVVLVPQHPILFTTTVFRAVEFPLRIRKVPKGERRRRVQELLELVGLRALQQEMAHRLSGGETQRIAIAQALACSPEAIFLDEPMSNVDVENQMTIERIIREVNGQEGISVLFTTHNMIQASRLAHESIFLFEGKMARSTCENIFSGHLETGADVETHCILRNALRLRVQTDRRGPVRISIDPASIRIVPGEGVPGGENTFKGRVIQLTEEHEWVRGLVDMGLLVSVLIPKAEARDLGLVLGEEVHVSLPIQGIRVFEEVSES